MLVQLVDFFEKNFLGESNRNNEDNQGDSNETLIDTDGCDEDF